MAFSERVATGCAPMLGGKVAVISGAGSGMGRAALRLFDMAGAVVIGADISEDAAKAAAAEVGVTVHVVDVTSAKQVADLMSGVADEYGRIDVLYNNAGLGIIADHPAPLHETPDCVWQETLNVNLQGTYLACRNALPHMLTRGGSIVNVSSTHGLVADRNVAAYCVSKGGVLQLTRSIAVDYAPYGIRANALCPGFVMTPMLELFIDKQPDRTATINAMTGATPAGRLANPEEIAAAAVWLSSDAATFVTGAFLAIDGGYTTI